MNAIFQPTNNPADMAFPNPSMVTDRHPIDRESLEQMLLTILENQQFWCSEDASVIRQEPNFRLVIDELIKSNPSEDEVHSFLNEAVELVGTLEGENPLKSYFFSLLGTIIQRVEKLEDLCVLKERITALWKELEISSGTPVARERKKAFIDALDAATEKNMIPRREVSSTEFVNTLLAFVEVLHSLYGSSSKISPENRSLALRMCRLRHYVNRSSEGFEPITRFAHSHPELDATLMSRGLAALVVISPQEGWEVALSSVTKQVLPFLQTPSEYAQAVREGFNVFAGEGNHGLGNFVVLSLGLPVTPANLNRLCWVAREVPSLDGSHFNDNRADALMIDDRFQPLRKLIHYQCPNVRQVLQGIVDHYDQRSPQTRDALDRALMRTPTSLMSVLPPSLKDSVFEGLGDRIIETDETYIEVIRRLRDNTSLEFRPPLIGDPAWDAPFGQLLDRFEFGDIDRESIAQPLTEINRYLERKMTSGEVGIHPGVIVGMLRLEGKLLEALQSISSFEERELFLSSSFGVAVIQYHELTTAPHGWSIDARREFEDTFKSVDGTEERLRCVVRRSVYNASELSGKYRLEGRNWWADSMLSGTLADGLLHLLLADDYPPKTMVGRTIQRDRAQGVHPGD